MKKYPNIGRTLAFLLVLAMLLPCISMPASSADTPCAEDGCSGKYLGGICSENAAHYEAAPVEGGVYKISNAGQLYWFAALVNAGENEYEGDNGDVYNAILTADITINADLDPKAEDNLAWTPIGLYTSAREFVRYSGTFDGNGNTIYGLYYDNTNYDGRNAGLFGILDANGTVKNLTLADSFINGATEIGGIVSHNYGSVIGCTQDSIVTGTGATGGIVCRNMDGARIEGCTNIGTVTGAATGGIAAENNGTVAGSVNSGIINGTSSVGGVVGMNDGIVEKSLNYADVTGSNTHVGGVVGNLVGGRIVGCGNEGDVTGASDYIGGVAGACIGAEITKSCNTGEVSGANKSDAVGGIAGAIDGTNTAESAITSCYNTGSITGRSWVGGIAGVSGYQKTPESVTVTNSYNTGAVSGTSRYSAVIGSRSKGTVSDTYYQASSGTAIDGATQASAEQFASGEIAYKLNGSTSGGELIWKQKIGTDASPKFKGAVVYFNSENGTYYNDVCTHTAAEAVKENEVAATCTEDGSYDSVVYCAECGEELSREAITVPALGHDWKGLVCQTCGETRENPFSDVSEEHHADFIAPIMWAVDNGITTGTNDGTTFSPTENCQRATVVTFLWRAAGEPKPTITENPFTDVAETDFFYEAVLWAVEEGITDGIAPGIFAPYQNCNRAQVVTFLWRCEGKPAPTTTEHPFTDVNEEHFGPFYNAILWAVGEEVTNGLTADTFGPKDVCNRAQVVTFLYRAQAE